MNDAPGTVRETAHAKINLALHVRERMADGYHRLETLFAFAEDGDELVCAQADQLSLHIDGPFAGGLPTDESNLVWQAAAALRGQLGIGAGGRLTLTKNLPVAAGIGGGSADAAAALRGLARLWGYEGSLDALEDIARTLGADIPACLVSQTCFGRGRGDRLRLVDATKMQGRPLLLVNPGTPVPTPEIFAAWDGRDRGALDFAEPLTPDPDWRNDLVGPAIALRGEIAEMLDRLEAFAGIDLVNMSGSGATCFALFSNIGVRDQAAKALQSEYPGWWVWTSRLR